MKECKIQLTSIEDVKEFVTLANKYEHECDLVSGRYAVDAKSIMGIFSLDLSKPLNLVVHGENGSEDELLEWTAKFAVN